MSKFPADCHTIKYFALDLLFGWFEVVAEEAELEKVRKCVEDTCDPADCRRTLRMWPPWWPPLLFEAVAVEDESPLEVDMAELR